MKRALLIIAGLMVLVSCASKKVYLFTSFHEPATEGLRLLYSYDGYKWTGLDTSLLKPEVGGRVMRDPSIAQGPDGTFHLVWTCGWKNDKGFGYASSKDLVHWSRQQFIPVMEHEPATVNVWAPEIFYDDIHKRFIIVWASAIPNRFPRAQEEETNNHRLYYTVTSDFKTFSKAGLFLDPGFSVIDAVIVKRGKADYVLVMKDNTRPNRNLKVSFSENALGPYTSASQPFTGNFVEGPSVTKAGDDWLVYYDAYQQKIYGAMKTKDFKSFTDMTTQVSVPEGHKHGTIFKASATTLRKLKKAVEK